MQEEDDPLFPNWDQDVSAIEDHYEEQDPSRVIDELRTAADALAGQDTTCRRDHPGSRAHRRHQRDAARATVEFSDSNRVQTVLHERTDDGETYTPSMRVTLHKVE